MRIYPFRGLRYSQRQEAGKLAGPPYDQIDDELRRQLHRTPRHFAHLIRPAADDGDPHAAAARLHQDWLARGVLLRDARPALYPYEIELRDGGRRLGVCALVGLEDPERGIVRPHEATLAKTVDERLSLLRKTRVDLEPILLLAEDDGRLDRLLAEDVDRAQPLVRHPDADGHVHLLYRIDEGERIAVYHESLASSVGLIADGHHRYTVASSYAREIGAEAPATAAAKLAVVTSLSATGIRIDPIHRLLRGRLDPEPLAVLASSRRPLAEATGSEIAAAVASVGQPSLAVGWAGRTEVWRFDPSSVPDRLSPHLRHLAVGWLHDVLLPRLGIGAEAATDGTVVYRSDPHRLQSELQADSAAVGFWLPPMSGEDFSRAMEGGTLLPPKSTRFLPKVASGLVWVGHDTNGA